MKPLLLGAGLFVMAASSALAQPQHSIQIIYDNSPALMRATEAEIAAKQLLYRTVKLKRRKATRGAVIDIISTVNAQVRWHGTPKDLARDGHAALGALKTIKNGCPNLLSGLDHTRLNLEMMQPKKAHVIVFSSLIHAYPCQGKTISLPQPVPADLDLSFLKEDNVRVTFLWAHASQKAGWLTAIRKAGLKSFRLLGVAETKALLSKRGGLFGE